MIRPLKLLIAVAAVAAAPVSAFAQVWPATVVAVAPRLIAEERQQTFLVRQDTVRVTPATHRSRLAGRPALKLKAVVEPDEIPDVELRAKDEWSDDQGFRVSPTRVGFKSRF